MAPNQHFTNGFQSTTTVSDITLIERNKEVALEETHDDEYLPIVSEVENAKCECCGMCEECTREYIRRVRDMFSGRLGVERKKRRRG